MGEPWRLPAALVSPFGLSAAFIVKGRHPFRFPDPSIRMNPSTPRAGGIVMGLPSHGIRATGHRKFRHGVRGRRALARDSRLRGTEHESTEAWAGGLNLGSGPRQAEYRLVVRKCKD